MCFVNPNPVIFTERWNISYRVAVNDINYFEITVKSLYFCLQWKEWRDIILKPGYQVSNLGNVRSVSRHLAGKNGSFRFIKGKPIKPQNHTMGYKRITFGKDEKFFLHRLVAIAFLPNPDKKPLINHKNLIKSDNNVSNLEWVTSKENAQHYLNHRKNDLL